MDVVPADASRWNPVDPFGGEMKDGHLWGRGAIDMKGTGVLQLYAFLTLARQKIPLDRDVIFLAVNDEEIGGTMGTSYMLDHHYEELDPEYVLDEKQIRGQILQ
jgi:acetylornithine deacetylase/succinyl-diaminopimelate desuccinylase-like protein